MKALGMIEVYGYLAAVEALDSALKAANVTMVDVTLVKGGLVTVLITGDVGAVKAAMDASKTAAERVGKVISVHVIPRPSEKIEKMIPFHSPDKPSSPKAPSSLDKQKNITPSDEKKLEQGAQYEEPQLAELTLTLIERSLEEKPKNIKETEQTVNTDKIKKENRETKNGNRDINQITPDKMMTMTVEQLRSLARELNITNMTRKQIRSATKHELIESISKFIEQER